MRKTSQRLPLESTQIKRLTQGSLCKMPLQGLLWSETGESGLEQSQQKTPNPQGQRELKDQFGLVEGKGNWSGEAC